jgi:DNA-binding NtrC family response regulator
MDFAAAQRIVIVADDDSLRDAMEMLVVISGAGQSIRSTASGREALRWLDEELCDLLTIDFTLPEMNGPTLYRRVLTRWPRGCPRALFVSGDTDVDGFETDPEVLAVPLLFRPCSIGELSAAVTRGAPTAHPSTHGRRRLEESRVWAAPESW